MNRSEIAIDCGVEVGHIGATRLFPFISIQIYSKLTQVSKAIQFLGSSLDDLRSFPQEARRTAGFQLNKVQEGEQPDDWKPIPGFAEE